jgi:fluoride exporter
MNSAALAALVACCGGVGAVGRYVADRAISARHAADFPIGTLIVNVGGSLLIGLVAGLVEFHGVSNTARVLVGTGFCGGLTTWSSASFETVRLIEARRYRAGVVFALGGLALSCAAAGAGLGLVSL